MQNTIQIEGRNPVLEALKSGRKAEKIFYLQSAVAHDDKIKDIYRLAIERQIPLVSSDRNFLDSLSKTASNQGVIGIFASLASIRLKDLLVSLEARRDKQFLAVLTAVDYEQNLGAILRTADAAGVTAIILPPHEKGVTPTVERISMGAASHVPVISESLFPAMKLLKEYGYLIVGIDVMGKTNYFEANLKGPVALVVGGESRGVTQPVIDKCDLLLRIPQKGSISTLNISVAFGVVAYEKVRQEMNR